MNLEEYRMVFTTGSLVLILIAAAPTLSLILQFPGGSERFSELWLLGPNHMAEEYPFNIAINETYHVFVGVSNHMGYSSHYLVYVKFHNNTQPFPDTLNSEPSPLPPLYEFRAFVADGENWEAPLTFKILEASYRGDSVFISRVSINDMTFSVNASTKWDSVKNGFHYKMLIELWLYNTASQSFQYHDRFVEIWLNMTD